MHNRILKIALRTTLFYGGIASIWILFSDWLVAVFTSDPATIEKISSFKGLAFVIVTATLLFFELSRQLRRWEKEVVVRLRVENEMKVSETKFRSYVEHAPVAVFVVNGRGRYVDSNPEASRLLGYDNAELLRLGIADVVTDEDRERVWREFKELADGGHIEKEYTLKKRDGSPALISLRAVKINDDRFVGFYQDITRSRQNEKALRESKMQVQYILNNTRDVIFQIDLLGNYIFANAAAERLTGYPLSRILQMSMWQLVPTDHHALLKERLQRRIAGETMEGSFEFEIQHQSGHRVWLELTTNGVFDPDGKLTAIQGVARDISDRKRAEEKFIRGQARFRLIFDTIPIGIAFHTAHPDGTCTRIINDAHLRICGLTRAQHDTPGIYAQITHPEDRLIQQQWVEKIQAGLIKQYSMVKRYLRRDGSTVWVNFSYQRENYPDGTIEELTTVVDITERQQAEVQLRKLSRAVEHSPASIVITDLAGNIEYVNPKFTEVTGYTLQEVWGKNPRFLKGEEIPPEEYQRLWQAITAGHDWRGKFHNRKKNGDLFWETASISPITDEAGRITHFLAVKEDITEHLALEEQFRQIQKVEAIGQLAGGVAHDFNNILAVIQMQAGMMRMEESSSPAQLEYANEIEKAAQRGANLTRQLLMFSRRQPIMPQDLDLNEVVTNIAKMLQRILGEDIQVQLKFAPQPLFTHADAGMMDQVLINLAVNSRDAMPRGGRLIVETAVVEFDAITAGQSPQARPGSFACLSVSDTGGGIPPEILPRIFEPFFTTKDVGKGTGLGLATVFGIVQQHQGWIDVYSNVGHGTTFRIYLPRRLKNGIEKQLPLPLTYLRGGHETILLVEDEPLLRSLVQRVLTRLGHRVLEAANSSSALSLWKQHSQEIHLLLTDLILPDGLNGKELAQQLLQERPDLKVLYASGYSTEVVGNEFPLEDGVNFLAKPYQTQKLAQTVRARLDN